MHKKLSFFLALVLIISVFTPNMSFASKNNHYLEAAEYLNKEGILKGSESGDLLLDQSLTRQDMVVMISRLYDEEELARTYKDKKYFSDINFSYYKNFISWAVDKKLIIGINQNEFGFNKTVDIQSYQAVLLRILGYEEESSVWSNVPKLAENLGIMKDIKENPSSEAKRDIVAAMTLNTLYIKPKGKNENLASQLNLTLPSRMIIEDSYFIDKDQVTIRGKVEGADKLNIHLVNKDNPRIKINKSFLLNKYGTFEVKLNGLISGKYEYSFSTLDGDTLVKGKEFEIKEPTLKLNKITAPNLKEIHISFNTPIKRDLLLKKDKIETNAGKVSNIRFEDRDKKVILILDNNSLMNNYKEYSIKLPSIESKGGQILENLVSNFIAKDEDKPQINEIISLGNKRLKLVLTEPVKHPSNYDFKIDGKNFNGRIQNKENTISLIFPTNSPLEKGQHKLEVSKLEDYFGNINRDLIKDFQIQDDKEELELVEYNANIDEVIFEFNKDIDPEFLTNKDFYWRIGRRKIHPDFLEVNGKNIKIIFNGKDTLPSYETPIYLSNIKDFYGNRLENSIIRVTAGINKNQPKINTLKVSEDNKSLILDFNKRVVANKIDSYILKNSKGEVINFTSIDSSPRRFKLNLASPLEEGSYKLTVKNIEDILDKNNILQKDELEFNVTYKKRPKVENYARNKEKVLISFTEDMDLDSITNPNNYLIKINNSWRYLPKDTLFETVENNRTLIINLPINLHVGESLKELQIIGLKSSNSTIMEPTILDLLNSRNSLLKAEKAKLINGDTIEVEFNQGVLKASPSDFYISNIIKVDKISFNSNNKLSLKLNKNISNLDGISLTILDDNNIENIANSQAQAAQLKIEDLAPPFILSNTQLKIKNSNIEIEFSKELDQEMSPAFKRDIIVERIDGSKSEKIDFSTRSEANILKIKLNDYKPGNKYKISFVEKPLIIMDKSANILQSSNKIFLAQ